MLAANTLVLVFISCSLGSFAQDVQEKDVKCPRTDIGFLLDYSDSVGQKNFERSKTAIKMLVKDFKVGVGGSRAGLITFSNLAVVRMPIEEKTTLEFNTEVDRIMHEGGNTFINKALESATDDLFGSQYTENSGIKNRVVFVLTDGGQTGGYFNLLPYAKQLATFRNARIIVVAVGDHPQYYNLYQMVANDQKDIVPLTTRARIRDVVNKAYFAACRKPQPAFNKNCSKRIDLGFALDASESIGETDFNHVRNFAINITKKLDLSKTETHVGVIVYSFTAKLLIKLNKFYDVNKFSDFLIRNTTWPRDDEYIGWMNGQTSIHLALTEAYEKLFSAKNGDRSEVRNVLVFLTDGHQEPPLKSGDSLENYAKRLKNASTEIMAIGFKNAKKSELEQIASSKENVWSNTDKSRPTAEILADAVEHIVKNLCNYCQKKVNLGFVLDASKTTENSFENQKNLVKTIVEGFSSKEVKSQFTLITFSREAKVAVRFMPNTEAFLKHLPYIPSVGDITNIYLGLRKAESEFHSKAYKDVPKILIVMTDGKQSDLYNKAALVKEEADKLRRQGFTIIAVKTNKLYSNEEVLKYIAGSKDNILELRSKADEKKLNEIAAKVVNKACPGKTLEPSEKASDQVDDIELLDEMEDSLMEPYIS